MIRQYGKMIFWTWKPYRKDLFSNSIRWWKFRLKLAHGPTANPNSSKLTNHNPGFIWKQTNIFEKFSFSLQASKLIKALITLIWLVKIIYSCFVRALIIGPSVYPYILESSPSMLESWFILLSPILPQIK
jgi:hypothetical protein